MTQTELNGVFSSHRSKCLRNTIMFFHARLCSLRKEQRRSSGLIKTGA
jgi:hypothetical protein